MTEFLKINMDWEAVKNCCRSTVRKRFTEGEPSDGFKRSLLVAEHSPIREMTVRWMWRGIPYWVAMEWARHKFEKYITSQRNDRQKEYDRNKAPQDAPVDFIGSANFQQLMDSFRKRLCFTASKEARNLAVDLKLKLAGAGHTIEAAFLVPPCVYRGGCTETLDCGHYRRFLKWWWDQVEWWTDYNEADIQMRYSAYQQYVARGEE